MSNMAYCRMENTYRDLRDCFNNWEDADSESEKKYRAKILALCEEIVADFGEPYEEDEEE